MWSKIYLAAFALAAFVLGFIVYYSCSWLESIGSPTIALEAARYHAGNANVGLWLAATLLLILANAVYWSTQRVWSIWLTFIYFAVFAGIIYGCLGPRIDAFCIANGLCSSPVNLGVFAAIVSVGFGAGIALLNNFLIVKLHRRIYERRSENEEAAEETTNSRSEETES